MTDTERRRFQAWYTEHGPGNPDCSPDFGGHWAITGRWVYWDAAIQNEWRIWNAALTFRTLDNV